MDEGKYTDSAKRALDGVLSQMDENGFIPGRLDENWGKAADWACLTGLAQIGIICLKAYKKIGDKKYLEAAIKAKDFLKTCQNNYDDQRGGLGAMWGSWPISGGYGQYEALNWATKYFVGLLIDLRNIK